MSTFQCQIKIPNTLIISDASIQGLVNLATVTGRPVYPATNISFTWVEVEPDAFPMAGLDVPQSVAILNQIVTAGGVVNGVPFYPKILSTQLTNELPVGYTDRLDPEGNPYTLFTAADTVARFKYNLAGTEVVFSTAWRDSVYTTPANCQLLIDAGYTLINEQDRKALNSDPEWVVIEE